MKNVAHPKHKQGRRQIRCEKSQVSFFSLTHPVFPVPPEVRLRNLKFLLCGLWLCLSYEKKYLDEGKKRRVGVFTLESEFISDWVGGENGDEQRFQKRKSD